jgi:restriction endonuclease S subunit
MPQPTRPLHTLGELFQAPFIKTETDAPEQRVINLRNLETLIVQNQDLDTNTFPASKRLERFSLREHDILIGIRAQPIRASVIPTELEGCYPGQNLAILRPKTIHAVYLSAVLRSSIGQHLTSALFSQSTVKLINLRDLGSLEIPTPPSAIQNQIANLALAHEFETQLRQRELEQRHELIDQAIRASLNR